MRILIVEDEAMIRVGLSRLIGSATEHEVVAEAKNGKEGLELYQRYKPDLIITDIRMPEMDGLQMLERIHMLGGKAHVALLTGYAEFEYAQKAVRFGAVDYLLKPIGVEDIKGLLDKVQKQIEDEQKRGGDIESCLRDLYVGDNKSFSAFMEWMEKKGLLKEEVNYTLYLGYIGAASADYKEKVLYILEEIMRRFPKEHIFVSCVDKMQEILIFTALTTEQKTQFEYIFSLRVLESGIFKNSTAIWVKQKVPILGEITEAVKSLQQAIAYFDRMPTVLSDTSMIGTLSFEEFIYPAEVENEMKICICNGETQKLEACAVEFKQYFGEHFFSPEHVQHGYLKVLSFIISLLGEIDAVCYRQIQNMCVLRRMADARILLEKENCLDDVVKFLQSAQGRKENIGNYTIKKAINYIREHYDENIGLEEIASQLEITPEYLSSLFNKEVGTNFSTFLKEFRISHAKRLLKGTDLKIYEVAEKVGYNDAKYFMRVFKEVQGMSPKEFRQN